jgi:hypothetical protein
VTFIFSLLISSSSSSWKHKLSLGALIPRLGDIPTDPTLIEKVKKGVKADKCFSGEGLVTWLVNERLASSPQEAASMGELLLKV